MTDGCERRIASGFGMRSAVEMEVVQCHSLYKQNAAARFFVDQTNGKVYEVVGGS